MYQTRPDRLGKAAAVAAIGVFSALSWTAFISLAVLLWKLL